MSAPEPGAESAPPPKPRLKINVSRSSSFVADASANTNASTSANAPPSTTTPGAPTPTEGARKVKLKITQSTPSAPAEKPPAKTKAGRQTKPTQKLVESKKRPHDDEDDEPLSASHPPARIKLKPTNMSKSAMTPTLVVKPKGRAPMHPPGDGYDSEASDREKDPSIEEQFVLRMMPGEHCDYVRWCMENGKIGVARSMGGADIQLKFFEEDTRRALLTVKGQRYAAVMVDLPTITEAMKTWDRKSFLKSADICQMLLVFQKVATDADAKLAPLPSMIDTHFKWPHGLTPPMHDCLNRRFAKTISRKEIEDKEAEVERLLAEDAKAGSTKWEWVDERGQDGDDEDGDEDAEGEVDDSMDYFQSQDMFGDEGDDDLEADLEAAFADDLMAETPATGLDIGTPMTTTQVNTPAVHDSIEADESEEISDDDDDDDDDDDLDDDARAQRDEEQGVKDIIADLQKQLGNKQVELGRTQNKILRTRLEAQIKQLKSEIELKKSSIGIEIDD
ncbi:TAFII55 protein conserved region-domain-containing protein [Dactylonectria macrodidyma]|uniref:TAFII55 protein conserved region-domain-containing protein n=1 Tax=Dactylonectria macrodidyma TaxID=307937 RepID=A0A9P9JHT1_9HYPO|nr:TAFII55 protein conserved region-domain-containing protein [Dactylonectria macrodidyma]